jgi:tagatose-1,6-bisphosphate aldolase
MKIIMTLIVTMAIATLAIQASTIEVNKEFTVTQIALDSAAETEAAMNQALEEIEEDKNTTIKGGDTDKK